MVASRFRSKTRRVASVVVLGAMLTPVFVASPWCARAATVAPAPTWSVAVHPGSGSVAANGALAWSTPAVGDLFGDGNKEVVAAFPDGSVWAWYATSGALVAGWPQYTHGKVD